MIQIEKKINTSVDFTINLRKRDMPIKSMKRTKHYNKKRPERSNNIK